SKTGTSSSTGGWDCLAGIRGTRRSSGRPRTSSTCSTSSAPKRRSSLSPRRTVPTPRPLLPETVSRGPEPACHGYAHARVYDQTPAQLRADLERAVEVMGGGDGGGGGGGWAGGVGWGGRG